MKVALFQLATNAVGKVPTVFENMLALYMINALEKAACLEVIDLTPPPREGEIISLTQVLTENEVRKAGERAEADAYIWGSLNFGPEGKSIIDALEVKLLVASSERKTPLSSRHFSFNALSGDVNSASIRVEMPALEDMVEEMLVAIADILGLDKKHLDLGKIGEGLTYSDRAMVYFIYALRISTEAQAKLRLYLKAISSDPYFALAYVNAAQLLIGEGDFAEAMRLLLRARKNLAGNYLEPNILNLIGVAALHLGMWDDAVRVWGKSLELLPDYAEVLCNLASAHAMRDMNGEAEEYYRRALSFHEDYPLAWFSLGRLLVKENRHDEAEEAMRRYIELCPGDPWAYYILGSCLLAMGMDNEAEFELAKATQLDPDGEAGALARRELQDLKD